MTRDKQKRTKRPHFIDRWQKVQPVFGLVLDRARDGIVLQDINARIEWINPACEKMFGWSMDEIRGHKPQEYILPPESRPSQPEIDGFRYDLSSSIFDRYEVTEHIRRDGSRFWNQQNFAVIELGPEEHQKKIVITCRDVSGQVLTEAALRRVQVDLEHAAYHDDLTGLANRKKLKQYLNSDSVAHHIARQEIAVLQVDIDKFKEINDTLGHAAGDATLVHVASALQANCGSRELVCRTGGDEFLLIYLRSISRPDLTARAENLLRDIARPVPWGGQSIRIGASIGVSMPTSNTCTGEALIQQADQALYSAKNDGRGRVVLYTDTLGRQQKAQQDLARDLKRALREQQFEIYLQPQLCLDQNSIIGCEALIRWNHPERGFLLPGEFLEPAESLGILTDIDYISMNLALDALLELRKAGNPDMCMAINVSSSILGDVNYPGLLDWAMQTRNLPPQCICVEILETTILEGSDLDIVTAVERLKRLGVRVALDDFGTGYAGLAHMTRFEIDAIKLDRSMIARLENDPRNRVIIRSIIRLCALLGMKVAAEGVETQDQLEILRRAKCPIIQGFGLAHPMSLTQTIDWLKSHTPLTNSVTFVAPEPNKPLPLKRDR